MIVYLMEPCPAREAPEFWVAHYALDTDPAGPWLAAAAARDPRGVEWALSGGELYLRPRGSPPPPSVLPHWTSPLRVFAAAFRGRPLLFVPESSKHMWQFPGGPPT